MDQLQHGRIWDDLKGFFKGDLLFDDLSRALYSTDASLFQVLPLGVVVPRDEEDVQGLVRYAREHRVPLIARGAGTGIAGEALGRGLIVDLSRHFRAILDVTSDSVRVQPGVTLAALNARLALEGRRFAPDPATQVCTLGGMLANNASGARSLRYGYTHDHVSSLRVVLDTGERAVVRTEPRPARQDDNPAHWHDIVSTLAFLLEQNNSLIRSCQPHTPFNRCGYALDGVLQGDHFQLPRLLVGSEGTLCLFTEATLRTVAVPGGRSLVLLTFASLEHALQAAEKATARGAIACELMDRRLVSLVRGNDIRSSGLLAAEAEAVVLVEYEADAPEQARALAHDFAESIKSSGPAPITVFAAADPEMFERLWQLREAALPTLYGLKGAAQPVPFIEDIGVPVDCLGEFLRRLQEILQEHEITASYLVHAATGQVHTRPFVDLQESEQVSKLFAVAEVVHSLVLDMKGTVSTQHGTGLARTPWVARQYGPLYPVFRQVKAIFDPRGIFNPGKIVDPDPNQPAYPLRTLLPRRLELPMILHWRTEELVSECNQCNGCGHCRTETPPQRMCPVFRAGAGEPASPRAKANLLRALLQEAADGQQLGREDVRAVADLCVNCKMCALECPARVNIPKLMLETKAAHVAQHGLDRHQAFLARLPGYLRWGSAFPFLANFTLNNRLFRWIFEKWLGLSARRRLPRFARRTFLKRATRHGWSDKPDGQRPWVVYVADVFVNHFDPLVGEATVRVLQHHGYDVVVSPQVTTSGIEALAQGDVDSARDIARRNLRVLAELAREAQAIVCSEPSTALMLKQEYLDLVGDVDARIVADKAIELTSFLGQLKHEGRMRTDFHPLDFAVGHHVPCHLKALGAGNEGPSLLALVPNLKVHPIDVSCSGMAGTFGLQAKNYATSLAAGRPLFAELEASRVQYGATECSSCRIQMEEGARKRTLHPIQYLALAYGLAPEIDQRLKEPIRTLVLR